MEKVDFDSNFEILKCRTTDISKFENWIILNLFSHFKKIFQTLKILNNFSNCKILIFQMVKLIFF